MRTIYTREAITDLVDALTYLFERDPTAAAHLEERISRIIDMLASESFDGPTSRLRGGTIARSWPVPPFRIYYMREANQLVVLRIFHQAQEPIER